MIFITPTVWIYKELRSVAGSPSGIPLPVTPKFKNNRKLAISKDEIQQSGYSVWLPMPKSQQSQQVATDEAVLNK